MIVRSLWRHRWLPDKSESLVRETASIPRPASERGTALVELSLLGTTDVEGRVHSLPLLAGYLANLRAERTRGGGALALFDAGDIIQGTLETNLNEGEVMIAAYDALGYSAATIGNHEFDHGPAGEAATPKAGQPEGPLTDPRGALKARLAQAKNALMGTMWPTEQILRAYTDSKAELPKLIAEAQGLLTKASALSTALAKHNLTLTVPTLK